MVIMKQVGKMKKSKAGISREVDPLLYHAKPKDLDSGIAIPLRVEGDEPLQHLKRAQPVPTEESSAATENLNAEAGKKGNKPFDEENVIFAKDSNFGSFQLDNRILRTLEGSIVDGGLGLTRPTTVQKLVLSQILPSQRREAVRQNLLIKSQTGSGKTLSYLLPILSDLMSLEPRVDRAEGCHALILAPTRELCGQITTVLETLTKKCCVWIVGGCITGGERKKSEKARLRKGITVLVSTPGRLLDHLQSTESFTLKRLRWVVLDEVDRLLDMGFEQTILQILSIIKGEKLPGLKEKNDPQRSKQKQVEAHSNLQQKWELQQATVAKRCANDKDLVLLMASATLTTAVKQLALPLLGARSNESLSNAVPIGFSVVDADTGAIEVVRSQEDILLLGQDRGRLDGDIASATITFDESNHSSSISNNRKGMFEKGEVVDAPSQLAQYYMMVTCKWRLAALISFLYTHRDQKVIVFFSTCDSVDYVSLLLREMLWPYELDEAPEYAANTDETDHTKSSAASPRQQQYLEPIDCVFTGVLGKQRHLYRLHGNVPQQVRKTVYQQFCSAERGILLCTDVAARGLDLPNVDWILQYDAPCDTSDYVHRIGRTARRGKTGNALIFLLPAEAAYIPLLGTHNLTPEPLSLQSLFLQTAAHIPGASKFKNTDEMAAVILQRRAERVVSDNRWLQAAGRQAFRSFVRAYATHSIDTKGIFSVQSLHLGHVAKSFGLRESPTALRTAEDVIGKICNGYYSIKNAATIRTDRRKRAAEEATAAGKSKKQKHSNSSSNSRQKLRKVGSTKAEGSSNEQREKNGRRLSASGKFRKTTGYFKKKIRSQMNSEFNSAII